MILTPPVPAEMVVSIRERNNDQEIYRIFEKSNTMFTNTLGRITERRKKLSSSKKQNDDKGDEEYRDDLKPLESQGGSHSYLRRNSTNQQSGHH